MKHRVSKNEDLIIVWKELNPLDEEGKMVFNSVNEKLALKALHLNRKFNQK